MAKEVEEGCGFGGEHDEEKPGFIFEGPLIADFVGVELDDVTRREGVAHGADIEKRLRIGGLGLQVVVFDRERALEQREDCCVDGSDVILLGKSCRGLVVVHERVVLEDKVHALEQGDELEAEALDVGFLADHKGHVGQDIDEVGKVAGLEDLLDVVGVDCACACGLGKDGGSFFCVT